MAADATRGAAKCRSAFVFGMRRLRLDMGENPPDEPGGDRPAGSREEAYAEPHANLMEVDRGRHVGLSLK